MHTFRQEKLTNDIGGSWQRTLHMDGVKAWTRLPLPTPLQTHLCATCSEVLLLFMALFALLFMGVHFKRYEHLLRRHVWLPL